MVLLFNVFLVVYTILFTLHYLHYFASKLSQVHSLKNALFEYINLLKIIYKEKWFVM